MATLSRRRRIVIAVLVLLVSHVGASAFGALYVARLAVRASEGGAYASMMTAEMAIDLETAMAYLAVAQSKAPDWYGPLVLSAMIYEQKGWPELSVQYLRRAQYAISASPEAEADKPWYYVIAPLGQKIDQKLGELEKRIAQDQSENEQRETPG